MNVVGQMKISENVGNFHWNVKTPSHLSAIIKLTLLLINSVCFWNSQTQIGQIFTGICIPQHVLHPQRILPRFFTSRGAPGLENVPVVDLTPAVQAKLTPTCLINFQCNGTCAINSQLCNYNSMIYSGYTSRQLNKSPARDIVYWEKTLQRKVQLIVQSIVIRGTSVGTALTVLRGFR